MTDVVCRTSGIKPTEPMLVLWFPDGEYEGVWGGYKVKFKVHDGEFEITTEKGVRGFVDVVVVIEGNEARVERRK